MDSFGLPSEGSGPPPGGLAVGASRVLAKEYERAAEPSTPFGIRSIHAIELAELSPGSRVKRLYVQHKPTAGGVPIVKASFTPNP